MRKGGKVGRVIDRPQNSARSTRNSFVLINATVAHIFYTMFSVRHKSFLLSGAAFLFLSFVLGQTIISQHMLNNRKEFFGMPVSSLSYFLVSHRVPRTLWRRNRFTLKRIFEMVISAGNSQRNTVPSLNNYYYYSTTVARHTCVQKIEEFFIVPADWWP